jgi:HEAT repeat protein
MDPATLAAAALAAVTPYLLDAAKDAAKQAAADAGKAVWDWIKGKLTGEAGKEAVADLEEAPAAPENALALQAALTKVLKKEPEAVAALAELLKAQGVAVTTQTATAIGNRNTIIQASGNSSVKNG